jgi:hypothetical protein
MVARKMRGAKRFESTNLILNRGERARAAAASDRPASQSSSISVAKERFGAFSGAA